MSDSQPRAAPTELRYGDTVPVAIPSEAQRMEFLPTNNGTFTYGQSQVITIDVNVDGFLDVANSMLQCELHNESTGTFCKAPGIAFVKRLRILNSGTVLEDINEYSALYSLLTAVQADESKRTHSIYTNENQFAKATMMPQAAHPDIGGKLAAPDGGGAFEGAFELLAKGLGGMTSRGGNIPQVDTYTLDASKDDEANVLKVLQGQPGWSGNVETSPVYPCPNSFVGVETKGEANDQTFSLNTTSSVENSHDSCLRGSAPTTESQSGLAGQVDQKSDRYYQMQFPIISALFNSTKMIPLCLSTAPLTIELTLSPPRDIGVTYKSSIPLRVVNFLTGAIVPIDADWPANTMLEATESPYLPTEYSIQNVRFVANVISLGQDFVNQLRQQVSESGSLALHSTAWRHFGATFQGNEENPTINIPARMKSIKTIVTTMRPQSGDGLGGDNDPLVTDGEAPAKTQPNGRPWNPWPSTNGTFTTGTRMQMGVSSWQFRCGAAHLPQSAVKQDPGGYASFQGDPVAKRGWGCGASYSMLMQGFGKLNQIDHQTSLSRVCYSQTGNTGCPHADDYLKNYIIAFDAESFGGKATIQSGIDTASRGLPLSLVLEREPAKGNNVPISVPFGEGKVTLKYGGLGSHDKQDPVLRKCGVAGSYVDNPTPKFVQVDTWVAADAFFYFGSDGSIIGSV